GAVLLLIEAVPQEVTRMVVESTTVPVIGIGAGTACHGQILVVHDLLGLSQHPPRFAQPAAELAAPIVEAGREWVDRVAKGEIGGKGYTMTPALAAEPAAEPGPATKQSPVGIRPGFTAESGR
ncbi:MAG: 3-methyl-2-oxobutanoate hydroxymethyltransferase, partial [Salinibacterium sp.]|nr:3-methyl-2-oxobutanoate hydroxymethyltransferase [Salinibacterium sp.]